jgi:hypothetical protein
MSPGNLTTCGTGLTICGDASGLTSVTGTPATIAHTPWSQSRSQTLDVRAPAGSSYTVSIGAGLGSFTFAVGMTADEFRDALIDALRLIPGIPVAADNDIAVGVKDVYVDKIDSSYVVTYLGLLRGDKGDLYGLGVAPNSSIAQGGGTADVTMNAVGGTFTLSAGAPANAAGALRTWSLGWNASDAEIAAALTTLIGSAVGVSSTIVGTQRALHVTGLGARTLTIDDRNLDNPLLVGNRRESIDYYGLPATDWLNIDLGSASDVFNVQGTTAITNVFAHGGDDRFYVSSLANENLVSAVTTDFLEGNLDDVLGNLNLHVGLGRHKLFISDESSVVGDGTTASPAVITDLPTTPTRLPGAEIELRGFSTGAITYQAGTTGHFADGITMWTGYGADTIRVDGTHLRNLALPGGTLRTITTLNTGLGDDRVTVDLDTGEDEFFVLNTQGPFNQFHAFTDEDVVNAQASTLGLVIFGGQDDDVLNGGEGEDLIFGDRGRVLYFVGFPPVSFAGDASDAATLLGLEALAVTVLGHGGPGDKTDGLVRHASVIVSVDLNVGDEDTVRGNGDDDILIGGAAGDRVDGNAHSDVVFGDAVALVRAANTNSGRFQTLLGTRLYSRSDLDVDPALTHDNSGQLLVDGTERGYRDSDGTVPDWAYYDVVQLWHTLTIEAGLGSAAGPNSFGDDYLAGGASDDVLFGQLGDDVVQGDGSIDLPHGDADAFRTPGDASDPLGPLTVIPSVEAVTDGDDYIEGGGGDDVVFGNLGQDDIVGGSSSLFSLDTAEERPDGADYLFGGAGTRIGIDDESLGTGVVAGDRHARDADVIAGDNADVIRIVGIGGVDVRSGNPSSRYVGYVYDDLYGGMQIVVRGVRLLDYQPGGPDFRPECFTAAPAGSCPADRGGDDEVHGETGDDTVYGARGGDRLFGDGDDDDLIGGWGHDWISGGGGQDGVLGDDGRIFTSRNGLAEPLFGIAAVTTGQVISTPGDHQVATIYVLNALNKAVDLTPFNLTPNENGTRADEPLFNPAHADDMVFGGLGDDFLHGGSGDDAVSGAEALIGSYGQRYENGVLVGVVRIGFDRPYNPGDALAFGDDDDAWQSNGHVADRMGEFALYDEYDPRRKLLLNADGTASKTGAGLEFFLNWLTNKGPIQSSATWGDKASDGNDVLFGDLGNDWMVGGTGKDTLWGGWGNDLMNADDDPATNGGLNDAPDTHPSYEDRVVGGAGIDILIGNTGGDRLIDWVGEFNSYLVPFSPFGMSTVSRQVPPGLYEFLYALSRAQGADPTRAADTGNSPARNGEPDGEVGLITQKDSGLWQEQTGGPTDPQPGNIPGGPRDVLRSADFNDSSTQAFLADSGVFEASGGALRVTARGIGGDAAAVFYHDEYLPIYYEISAQVAIDKSGAGWDGNAYVIFDYFSETDFKFAGINHKTNKLEMGHRTAAGWLVDASANMKIWQNQYYAMLIAINGTAVTVSVDSKTAFTHVFGARVIDGEAYGLNKGMVGVGSANSRGYYDNVKVQVLPPQITLDHQEDFEDGSAGAFTDVPDGSWQVQSGRYVASATQGMVASLADLGAPIRHDSYLEITATFSANGMAGIVLDRYGADDYKYVALDVATGRVVLGHVNPRGSKVDLAVSRSLLPATDYSLQLTLKGITMSVLVNGSFITSFAYNGIVVDGDFGLAVWSGTASYAGVRIRTNDRAFPVGSTEPLSPSGATTTTSSSSTTTISSSSESTIASGDGGDATIRSGAGPPGKDT